MEKLFLPFELAKLAKEKGFDEPCFGYYGLSGTLYTVDINKERTKYKEDTDAPLYQQILDWLEEKHNIVIQPQKGFHGKGWKIGKIPVSDLSYARGGNKSYRTKYEALDKAIEQALNLIR